VPRRKKRSLETAPETIQDPVFPRTILDSWLKVYPGTKVYELLEASHFLQEDAPDEIVKIIREFLYRTNG
jgi:pimeloyl-ACP methyl ester carboxylesterase